MKIGDRVLVQSKFPDSTIQKEYGVIIDTWDFLVTVELDKDDVYTYTLNVYEIIVIT